MPNDEFFILAHHLPDAMCLVTASGDIIAANEATARFLKSDIRTIQEKTLFELFADNKDKVKQHLRNWSRSRETIPGPLNIRINGTEVIPCNCSGNLLHPKTADKPAAILLRFEHKDHFSRNFTALNNKISQLQKEITVRQRTEQELAKSKAEFEAMFNSIPDAVLFVDSERNIVMNNPAAHTMFGYSSEELIGNSAKMFYANEEDYNEQSRRRYDAKSKDESGAYEVRYKRKDGNIFWSETVSTQVKDGQNNAIGFIALTRDITERKQAEEEIKNYRDHLEELVKERTIELENSNKELESYSYSIAHDLRSPLRSITSFSQILLEDANEKLDSTEKDHLNRIISSSGRMANLIDNILELSRVARFEIQFDDVDLSSICADVRDGLKGSSPDRKVDWNIQPGVTVNGDYHLLYIVLSNLLANAWKFTQHKPHPQIEFGQMIKADEKIFYVKDNGTGFNMDHSKKLFGLFQRLHHPDEFEGTGIGLATVQRIINRHNGWVKIEGEIDKGATVYFSIPDKTNLSGAWPENSFSAGKPGSDKRKLLNNK